MYRTVDPTSGEVIREFADLSDEEATHALERADAAYRSWSALPIGERAAIVGQIGALHRERTEELAELMTLEMGKPITQSRAEVQLAASIYEYYGQKGPALLADETLDIAGAGVAIVRTEPIGALLGVMPWNFPLYQVARFVAPNLLLGNTILLKHASNCPQLSLAVEQIASDAGASNGEYANVFVTHGQIEGIIASPLLQGVSLTGSESAGRRIGGLAGQNLKKCVLELGGSDPLIILPGADIPLAVTAAATGRFWNAGQACTSMKRTIVSEEVWDDFFPRFLEEASTWHTGDPKDPDTKMGPLSSPGSRRDVAELVDDAVAKGAKVHLGGTIPEGDGAYYPATVLSGVTPDMRLYHEEIFGPVAVVYKVASTDAAVDLANDSPFGLGSAVFAGSGIEADEVAGRLEVGMVGVNMLIRSAPDLPFGGVKNSGIGRELGRFGLDEFANKKLVRRA
ncbi:NAD-dependent succinate-semialdehyde dehydrogenase [Subtercola frigoramans]|uniref:Succinate-semialdehyde dehydrogenase/glutarate-semialdehyde dehydrogenase n=1 Tax=Subtercola frigoramans TaxID=120298 RepID=A0ABS2L1A9_9MICO|nr:NAD-dependent succinate-semialdehyde dehydrogenase [Subtercola frigoramans]MBM7470864.1 succinate-semialdehyde dehydrogenase/glutarate-semialdehyde dehydrogenase [Subtercola frigoramans]